MLATLLIVFREVIEAGLIVDGTSAQRWIGAGPFEFEPSELMKLALVLNAINPRLGGVLIRGEKGTAKSTAARGIAALLPPLAVVEGCRFVCDPTPGAPRCPECAALESTGDAPLPASVRAAALVELG